MKYRLLVLLLLPQLAQADALKALGEAYTFLFWLSVAAISLHLGVTFVSFN